MKLLHTSDWHLGKVFHEHSLLEDQKFFLSQLTQILYDAKNSGEPYDALVVAGDIYDRAVPAPEAVVLLSDFLSLLNREFSSLHVFMISGNHDSPSRLAFASSILAAEKIHIATDDSKLEEPVVLKDGDEATAFYSIPFLFPARMQSQEELMQEACKKILQAHELKYKNAQSVVIAHSFITAAAVGGSERRFVGEVDSVSKEFFLPFTYTALGHIHKEQGMGGKSVYYSGAPLVYAFDDFKNQCAFLSVVLKENKIKSLEEIPVKPLHKVVRLEGNFSDFFGSGADKKIIEENQDNYVEFVLKGLSGIDNPMGLLRQNFPNALSIKKAETTAFKSSSKKKAVIDSKSGNKSEALFNAFIDDVYDGKRNLQEADCVEEKKIFLELAKKYSWE